MGLKLRGDQFDESTEVSYRTLEATGASDRREVKWQNGLIESANSGE